MNLLTALGLDEVIVRTTGAEAKTMLTDALGSIVGLVDTSGFVSTEHTYEPFGRTTSNGASSDNDVLYTARELDATGLYYYRARYYDPARGRFLNQDPIGFSGGDTNLYAYVGNRPTMSTDPLGLWLPDDHEELTSVAAQQCGLSRSAATDVAAANRSVDSNPFKTLSPSAVEHGMPDSPWRKYADHQLRVAILLANGGDVRGARLALGRGLHAIQDARAHDLRTPQGTIGEHIPRIRRDTGEMWISPDSRSGNPAEWQEARRASMDYIASFMTGRGKQALCGPGELP